jgi:hypothetical protein
MDQAGQEVVETLSPMDSELLKNQLMGIIKTIVSNNLL